MADTIKLVKGDSKPVIILTLSDDVTNSALDISSASITVSVRFALVNGTLLNTITCTKVNTGADGKVQFDFSGGILDNVDPGEYQGEIVVATSGAGTETVYDKLRFRVRDNLA